MTDSDNLNEKELIEAINQLQDEDPEVRKNAADVLADARDEQAIEPLINALNDENPQVRFKSAQALGNMGKSAVNPLIEVLNQAEGETLRYATFALK